MGSNISAHIEVKRDGVWHHLGQPRIDRDYLLFAAIGGERIGCFAASPIRDLIKPVASVKVLPDDISLVTRIGYEYDKNRGLHNISVLTAEDLPMLQDQLYKLRPEVSPMGCDELDLEWSIFRTFVNGSALADHPGWDDLRIVCWFTDWFIK